jgi:hypothetical protein
LNKRRFVKQSRNRCSISNIEDENHCCFIHSDAKFYHKVHNAYTKNTENIFLTFVENSLCSLR